jgi:hypothetical protein
MCVTLPQAGERFTLGTDSGVKKRFQLRKKGKNEAQASV